MKRLLVPALLAGLLATTAPAHASPDPVAYACPATADLSQGVPSSCVRVDALADPIVVICPILVGLAGKYGVVVIYADGDVVIAAIIIWDCPPYAET